MINFDKDRWARVKENYAAYWNQTSQRPILGVCIYKDPGRAPSLPMLDQSNATDFSVSEEQIIDRIDFELSCYEYYGDAYPRYSFEAYGPGILAAFLGAVVDNSTGRIWFHGGDKFEYNYNLAVDYDSPYLRRLRCLFKLAGERWQGGVAVGMADLGGLADVLYTFRSGEKLLFDMYDYREDAKAQLEVLCGLWHEVYDLLYTECAGKNAGYTDWSGLYSDSPSYVIQSDFAYMVGQEEFDEVLLPTIAAQCERLDRTIYHLDGVGQIKHLDSLLSLKRLNAVQWIYGDGKPEADAPEWIELYERVLAAGKSVQLSWCSEKAYHNVMATVSNPCLINRPMLYLPESEKDRALAVLKKYNIEL